MIRAGEAHRRMEALPLASVSTILDGRAPLILAPHADDESLGCGGLIAEACAQGLVPYVVIMTDGTGSHPSSRVYPAAKLRALREAEARAAVACLGLPGDRLGFLRLRDTAVPTSGETFDAAVAALHDGLRRAGCGIVVAPWRFDPHGDHEATHLIAVELAGRAGIPHLSYPVWGWTLPPDSGLDGPEQTGFRLDITRHGPAKRLAIACHASQHGRVIADDPGGFQLPSDFLALFDRPFETFLRQPLDRPELDHADAF